MQTPRSWLAACSACTAALFFALIARADQVVPDDQIVQGSICVGAQCMDGEFDPNPPTVPNFDTVKIKGIDPHIRFFDTSSSGSFPTNDWRMGITEDAGTGTAYFYILDVSSGLEALRLQAVDGGGVALGTGSEVVAGAVSVGAPGTERPVVNVAPGVDDTDAVNRQQFDDFEAQVQTDNAAAIASLEGEIADTQDRIDAMSVRIDELLSRLDAL